MQKPPAPPSSPPESDASAQQWRIPLLEESLQVSKKTVDTGRGVRLHKQMHERPEQLELSLAYDEVNVERIVIDRMVTGAVPVARYEGATLVVPVLEEVLQVQRQWRLKEELRITRRQRHRTSVHHETLRFESLEVETFSAPPESGAPS